MQTEQTEIKGIIIITPQVFKDDRGYFMESYNERDFEKFTSQIFVQDNESLSQKNVLRGLHFQKPPYAQAKLIRVITGSIMDVAVDLRKDSPTYGKYFSHLLSGENKKQIYIPEGFAHGFLSLEDHTIINYKCSRYYSKIHEDSLLWNDKILNINWNIKEPILTEKDRNAKIFSIFESPF